MIKFSQIKPKLSRESDFKIFATIAVLAMLIGSIGVYQVLIHGNHGGLTNYVPWGVWVGTYVYLVWLEVGMILSFFALKRFFRVKGLEKLTPIVYLAAIAALLAALFTIGMDLGHPLRFYKAYVSPNFSSMMTWMIWLHTIYLLILSAELFFYWKGKESVQRNKKWIDRLTYISIPFGIILIGNIGGLFGVISARPFWNASVLPLMFFIASIIAGLGLLTLLHLLFSPIAKTGKRQYRETAFHMARIFFGGIILGIIAVVANAVVIAYPNVPAHAEGLKLVLFGPYWWSLWIVHLGMGVLIPLLLLFFARRNLWAIGSAAFLYVLGFTMVPVNIIVPGLAYPSGGLEGLVNSFHHYKLTFDYSPGGVEWLVVLFAFGTALLVFTLGYKFLVQPYLNEKSPQNKKYNIE